MRLCVDEIRRRQPEKRDGVYWRGEQNIAREMRRCIMERVAEQCQRNETVYSGEGSRTVSEKRDGILWRGEQNNARETRQQENTAKEM